ncbi:MAG: hypothetical protein ACE5I1_04110 [bacterium]
MATGMTTEEICKNILTAKYQQQQSMKRFFWLGKPSGSRTLLQN